MSDIAAVHIDELIRAARSVGVDLRQEAPVGVEPTLYVRTTPAGSVLYIGKQKTPRRARSEDEFVRQYNPDGKRVGFVAMAVRHQAVTRHLHYRGPFDPTTATTLLDTHDWDGDLVDALRTYLAAPSLLTVEDVEILLVRIMVISGHLVANSVAAGQWEAYWTKPLDTLATVAVVSGCQNLNPRGVPSLGPEPAATDTSAVATTPDALKISAEVGL